MREGEANERGGESRKGEESFECEADSSLCEVAQSLTMPFLYGSCVYELKYGDIVSDDGE